jgi:hypothetical protein
VFFETDCSVNIKEKLGSYLKKLYNVGNMGSFYPRTRLDVFLEAYIRNGFCNAYRAALEAGYAETTARAQSKRILDTAMRKMLARVADTTQ